MPVFRTRRMLLAIGLPIAASVGVGSAHVTLHIGDVVEFGNVAILLHIWAPVLGHGGKKVVNDLVRDEGVSEIELCDVWLYDELVLGVSFSFFIC